MQTEISYDSAAWPSLFTKTIGWLQEAAVAIYLKLILPNYPSVGLARLQVFSDGHHSIYSHLSFALAIFAVGSAGKAVQLQGNLPAEVGKALFLLLRSVEAYVCTASTKGKCGCGVCPEVED